MWMFCNPFSSIRCSYVRHRLSTAVSCRILQGRGCILRHKIYVFFTDFHSLSCLWQSLPQCFGSTCLEISLGHSYSSSSQAKLPTNSPSLSNEICLRFVTFYQLLFHWQQLPLQSSYKAENVCEQFRIAVNKVLVSICEICLRILLPRAEEGDLSNVSTRVKKEVPPTLRRMTPPSGKRCRLLCMMLNVLNHKRWEHLNICEIEMCAFFTCLCICVSSVHVCIICQELISRSEK